MESESVLESLRRCRGDVELATLSTSLSQSESSILIDPARSGIFNRIRILVDHVVPDEELKIALPDLAMIQLMIEQFIVYEIYAHLPRGVGLPILDRLKKHNQSVVKVELETIRCRYDPSRMSEYAGELLSSVKLLQRLGAHPLFAGGVKRYQVDILTSCLQLGFGRVKGGAMFAKREQGMEARSIMVNFIDNECELGSVMSDLIQLRSLPECPPWMSIATSKVLNRCFTRPNAIIALVNGVLISDRVKLRHESVVAFGRLLSRNPGSESLTEPYKTQLEQQLKALITSVVIEKHGNVNVFVASVLAGMAELTSLDDFFGNDKELTFKTLGLCFAETDRLNVSDNHEIMKFLKSKVSLALDVLGALIDNRIEKIKKYVLAYLSGIMSNECQNGDLNLLDAICAKNRLKLDFELSDCDELLSNESKVKMMAQLVDAVSKKERIKVFYWSLRRLYEPKSQLVIHGILAEMLAREPDSIGLDLGDENVLHEIVNILALLLEKVTDSDTLQLVLAIVALSISDLAEMELTQRKTVKEALLEPIQSISTDKSREKKVRRTATDLSHVILTGGAVKPKPEEDTDEEETDNITELTAKMTLTDWSAHLTDKLLPIRAGALRELTKAIKRGDKVDFETKKKLKEAAQRATRSQESFLFLSGIEALATLALEDGEVMREVMKHLETQSNPNLALQSGEVVARLCGRLGDMAPFYASQLVPLIMTRAQKCSDPMLIASALSTGADLIPLLGFYLHDIQHELCEAITGFLCGANELEVRLAVCVLGRHLFQRLASGTLFTVLDETLAPLYRVFKKIRDDFLEDDTLRTQELDFKRSSAALAIEGLDAKVKENFNPSAKLEKKITVLG